MSLMVSLIEPVLELTLNWLKITDIKASQKSSKIPPPKELKSTDKGYASSLDVV